MMPARNRDNPLTPYEKEMIISGHPELNHSQVSRLYGISKVYASHLRRGLRGMKGPRGNGVKRGLSKGAIRTMNEHKFYASVLEQAVPLLRSIVRAEQELRNRGVFHTKIEREAKRERRWRRARIEEDGGAAAPGIAPPAEAASAYLPRARERDAGKDEQGLLFDSRRAG